MLYMFEPKEQPPDFIQWIFRKPKALLGLNNVLLVVEAS